MSAVRDSKVTTEYSDKELTCNACQKTFTFTGAEQLFFAQKGLSNEPKRCSNCRLSRRMSQNNRQTFTGVCGECGIETQLPFKPTGIRPVYCIQCFKTRAGTEEQEKTQ